VFVRPIKVLDFFSSSVEHLVINPRLTGGMTDPDSCRAVFAPGAGHKAIGEASPIYATNPPMPAEVMHDIFRLLGVDEHFVADTSDRHNVAGAPRSALMRALMRKTKLLRAVRRMLPKPVGDQAMARLEAWRSRIVATPALAPEARRRLVDVCHPGVELLQDRLGRDLSCWLA
jgi:hypothetical protein